MRTTKGAAYLNQPTDTTTEARGFLLRKVPIYFLDNLVALPPVAHVVAVQGLEQRDGREILRRGGTAFSLLEKEIWGRQENHWLRLFQCVSGVGAAVTQHRARLQGLAALHSALKALA